jgi:sister chromatid cohesion protein DCC1
LRNLLEKCSYKGSELENEVLTSNEMYNFEKLSALIQASDNELKCALKDLGAFQIDGNIVKNINVMLVIIIDIFYVWTISV